MPQKRLNNDEFLSSLTSLLTDTTSAGHGSIFLTQKPLESSDSSQSAQVLIRATNGASGKTKSKPHFKVSKEQQHKDKPKIKLATVIEAGNLESFYTQYADVCKKGMEGMRKRDKKKAKEKAKAAKKKKGTTA